MPGPNIWWMAARASGIVAWMLASGSIAWGLFLSSGVLGGRRRPAWLLDLHRWLGALTVGFTAIHITSLVADSYVHFGVSDIFVPGASAWHPIAVALGIVAMYLLVAVEVSSLLMKRLPRRWWKAIHTTSFLMFVSVTAHAVTAGSDVHRMWFHSGVAAVASSVVFLGLYRTLAGSLRSRRVGPAAA